MSSSFFLPRTESSWRRTVFITLTLAYSLAFLHRMSPTVVAGDIMRDFGSSGALMGLLASAYFYPYAFMQIPGGILTDKFGTRRLVSLALIVASVGSALFSLADGPALAFVGRIIVGTGLALILVPANKALSQWFPAQEFVMASSALLALATGIGSLSAGAPLALASSVVGWRFCFMGLAVVTLAMGLIVIFYVRDSPAALGFSSPEPHVNTHSGAPLAVKEALALVLTSRNYWMIGAGFATTGAVFFSFIGLWVGPFLTEVGGMSKAGMGTVLSVIGVISVLAPISFAAIARKVSSRKVMLVAASVAVTVVSLWGVLRNGQWGIVEMCVWTACLAFSCICTPGIYFTAIKESFPLAISGTATGLAYALPMLCSALYQPLVGSLLDNSRSGPVLDAAAFQPVLWLFLFSSATALVTSLLIKKVNLV